MHTSNDPQPPTPVPASRGSLWLVLFLVLGLAVWFFNGRYWEHKADPDAVPRAIMARGDLAGDEQATIALFRQASPSVVYITTLATKRDIFNLNLLQILQ